MAKKIIRTGTTADPTGDSLKNAFVKVNENFTELYNALGLDSGALNIGAFEFTGSVMSTTDSSAIVIDQATTITSNLTVGGNILPQTALGGDLGSSTLPWRSLYVSNNTIYIGGVPLGIDANNNLTVNGSQIAGGAGDRLVNGANTVSLGSDGNLTFPNGMTMGDLDGAEGIQGSADTLIGIISQGTSGSATLQWVDDPEDATAVAAVVVNSLFAPNTGTVQIITGDVGPVPEYSWTFGPDGSLTLPNQGPILFGGNNCRIQALQAFSISSDGGIAVEVTDKQWLFWPDGSLALPTNGTINYAPDDSDNWNEPAVNTIQAALDELAARVTALQNFEIDGGNAYTPAAGELIIDGNGA
jgi:hypothetical protein